MKFAIAALIVAVPTSSYSAENCDTYTHELFPPGEEVVMRNGVDWVFVDANGQRTKYYDVTGGTGIPQRGMRPVDGTGESFTYRFIQEGLLIDMEIYEPYCP